MSTLVGIQRTIQVQKARLRPRSNQVVCSRLPSNKSGRSIVGGAYWRKAVQLSPGESRCLARAV